MKSFRELIVWQRSMDLVTEIYETTSKFPNEELYGLTSQIRRAAVSIPSNIAEGFGRKSDGDFKRFLNISIGSNFELQTQVEIAFNLKYISELERDKLIVALEEISRMTIGLKAKIN